MARMRMVTRTVSENTYTCMCVDVINAEIGNCDFIVGVTFDTDEAALKYFQKEYDTPEFKVVSVVNHTVKEILYGMPESDFIRLAKVLPARSTNSTKDSEN